MATLQELVATIRADAHKQMEIIDQETQKLIADYLAETETLAAQKREQVVQEAHAERDELLARAQAKQRLHHLQETLQAKQELLDEVFSEALSVLTESAEKRRKLIASLFESVRKQSKVASVLVVKKDARFFAGKGVGISYIEGQGGFIAVSKDQTSRIDCTFETLLDDLRARDVQAISAILFNGEKKEAPPVARQAKRITRAKIPVRKHVSNAPKKKRKVRR